MGANAQKRAAQTTADAQRDAALIQSYSSSLRPVGLKTGLGSTDFTYETGPGGVQRVSGATYNLDPRLTQLQNLQYGLAPEVLEGGIGLFRQQLPFAQEASQRLYGLAGDIIPQSADLGARAQQIAAENYALMDPQRQREEQRLGASVFGRGRQGLNISGMGQPELFGLGQARAEQDARIAAQAREQARAERAADIQLGTGLFSTAGQTGLAPYQTLQGAYAPYNTVLGGITGIEDIGFGLQNQSVALGGGNTSSNIGSMFSQAAQTAGQGQSDYIRALQSGIGNFAKQIPFNTAPTAGPMAGWGNNPVYDASMYQNPYAGTGGAFTQAGAFDL
jgi:hypothetical protein